jgi:hypothetical protein
LAPIDLESEIAQALLPHPRADRINLNPHRLSTLFRQSDQHSTVPTTHVQNALAPQHRPLTQGSHNLPTPLNVTCRVIPPGLSIQPDPVFVRGKVCSKGGWKVVPFDLTLLDCLFYSAAFVGQNHLKKGSVLLASKIILTSSLEYVSQEEVSLRVLGEAGHQGACQVPQASERPGKLAVGPDHFLFRHFK